MQKVNTLIIVSRPATGETTNALHMLRSEMKKSSEIVSRIGVTPSFRITPWEHGHINTETTELADRLIVANEDFRGVTGAHWHNLFNGIWHEKFRSPEQRELEMEFAEHVVHCLETDIGYKGNHIPDILDRMPQGTLPHTLKTVLSQVLGIEPLEVLRSWWPSYYGKMPTIDSVLVAAILQYAYNMPLRARQEGYVTHALICHCTRDTFDYINGADSWLNNIKIKVACLPHRIRGYDYPTPGEMAKSFVRSYKNALAEKF